MGVGPRHWWNAIFRRGRAFNDDEIFSATLVAGVIVVCVICLAYEYLVVSG